MLWIGTPIDSIEHLSEFFVARGGVKISTLRLGRWQLRPMRLHNLRELTTTLGISFGFVRCVEQSNGHADEKQATEPDADYLADLKSCLRGRRPTRNVGIEDIPCEGRYCYQQHDNSQAPKDYILHGIDGLLLLTFRYSAHGWSVVRDPKDATLFVACVRCSLLANSR